MSNPIKHVVMVMLENHSFDNMLGYLYTPTDGPSVNIPALKDNELKFNGLAYVNTSKLTNYYTSNGNTYSQDPVNTVRATNSPGTDPGETYSHVNMQIFGVDPPPAHGTPAAMKGFLQDYSTQCGSDPNTVKQIMHSYTPADIPALSALAKNYAVSDLWFASVPTQTNANRAYSIAGTSVGLVDNGF